MEAYRLKRLRKFRAACCTLPCLYWSKSAEAIAPGQDGNRSIYSNHELHPKSVIQMKTTISIYHIARLLTLDIQLRFRKLPSFKLLIPLPLIWLTRFSWL